MDGLYFLHCGIEHLEKNPPSSFPSHGYIASQPTCAIRSPYLHCRCPPPSEPLLRWRPPQRGPTCQPSAPPPASSSHCTPAPPVSCARAQQEAVTVGSNGCLLTATHQNTTDGVFFRPREARITDRSQAGSLRVAQR